MPAVAQVIDTLLSLGEEIAKAADTDDWERVSMLVEQRAAVAKQLPSDEDDFLDAMRSNVEAEKRSALSDQNNRLRALLSELQSEIEEELAQIDGLRHAQKSYVDNSSRSGVLPPELRG